MGQIDLVRWCICQSAIRPCMMRMLAHGQVLGSFCSGSPMRSGRFVAIMVGLRSSLLFFAVVGWYKLSYCSLQLADFRRFPLEAECGSSSNYIVPLSLTCVALDHQQQEA